MKEDKTRWVIVVVDSLRFPANRFHAARSIVSWRHQLDSLMFRLHVLVDDDREILSFWAAWATTQNSAAHCWTSMNDRKNIPRPMVRFMALNSCCFGISAVFVRWTWKHKKLFSVSCGEVTILRSTFFHSSACQTFDLNWLVVVSSPSNRRANDNWCDWFSVSPLSICADSINIQIKLNLWWKFNQVFLFLCLPSVWETPGKGSDTRSLADSIELFTTSRPAKNAHITRLKSQQFHIKARH